MQSNEVEKKLEEDVKSPDKCASTVCNLFLGSLLCGFLAACQVTDNLINTNWRQLELPKDQQRPD